MAAAATSSSSPIVDDNNTNTNNNHIIEIDQEALFSQIDRPKMQQGGFNILSKPFISQKSVEVLRHRMERVFAGEYSTGTDPTKTPAELSTKKNKNNNHNQNNNQQQQKPKSVIHMINISKADKQFQQLALHPAIGEFVAKVMNWPSVKFAQDQVWCKPPGSGALSFHRDSPYFDMVPQDVATLWITFDDLSSSTTTAQSNLSSSSSSSYSSLGPLEYCFGSHLWGRKDNDGDRSVGARTGSANQFFDPDYYAMLRSAAQCEGIDPNMKRENGDDITVEKEKQSEKEEEKTSSKNNDGDNNIPLPKSKPHKNSPLPNSTNNNQQPKVYLPPPGLRIEVVEAKPGGGSIHCGRCYHGSGPNRSVDQPRRGIGIHYVRGDAKFKKRKIVEKVVVNEETGETKEVEKEVLKLGRLWEPLKAPDGSDNLVEEFFPTIYPLVRSSSKRRERDEECEE